LEWPLLRKRSFDNIGDVGYVPSSLGAKETLVWPRIERQAFMNTGLTSGKMGAMPSLSAIDFGQRRSPLKSGISRTAGKCRWSTTVERTLVAQIAIIETPVKGETASNPPPIEPNALT
jgi:hypothetical protein